MPSISMNIPIPTIGRGDSPSSYRTACRSRGINLKIEVGAIIVNHLCLSLLNGRTVFEEATLDVIGFLRHDGQCAVNIMKLK